MTDETKLKREVRSLIPPERIEQSIVFLRGEKVMLSEDLARLYDVEQGVAMLSTVLNSDRAILVNIEIMRAFVKLRRMLTSHAELAQKLEVIERKYDGQFKVVFDTLRQLMAPSDPPKKKMGFHTIRESAKEQSTPPKPTASKQPSKRKGRTDA